MYFVISRRSLSAEYITFIGNISVASKASELSPMNVVTSINVFLKPSKITKYLQLLLYLHNDGIPV